MDIVLVVDGHVVIVDGVVTRLHGNDTVFEYPYLQFSVERTEESLLCDFDGDLPIGEGGGKAHVDGRIFFHLLSDLSRPVGIVHGSVTVDETHRLVFQRPVVIVFVAQVGGQSQDGGRAFEAQRAAVDAYGNEVFAVNALQLFDDLGASGAVDAFLTSEVLQQDAALHALWLNIDESVVFVDVVAGCKEEADET